MKQRKSVIGIQSMARPKKIDGVSRHGKHAIGVFGVSLCLSAVEELINKVKCAASMLKFTVFASIAGCAIDCGINAGITYVLGVVYAKVLVKSVNDGNGKPPSIDALKDAMKEEFKNTDEMKRIFKEGKAAMRNTNYKDFKADAKAAEEYAQS